MPFPHILYSYYKHNVLITCNCIVCEKIGIEMRFHNCELSLSEVVRILPLARCYQRVDELGKQ
jgi:hypothetical protein